MKYTGVEHKPVVKGRGERLSSPVHYRLMVIWHSSSTQAPFYRHPSSSTPCRPSLDIKNCSCFCTSPSLIRNPRLVVPTPWFQTGAQTASDCVSAFGGATIVFFFSTIGCCMLSTPAATNMDERVRCTIVQSGWFQWLKWSLDIKSRGAGATED
jgi:hypothetical protein